MLMEGKKIVNSNDEICALIAKERQCRVSQHPEELAQCYWPDATVITSWTNGNVPVKEYLYGGKAPVHDPECPIVSRISYPIVHQEGERAYVEAPQSTYRWSWVNGEKAVLICFMRLIYRVERRNGEWKIVEFKSIYESDMLVPEIPGTDLKLDKEELSKLRHSYRYLAYVDDNVNPELPGIDRPDVVKSIYADLDAWLKG